MALAGILMGFCDNKLISVPSDPSNDAISLRVFDKYFIASITLRALKLSKPVVISSQKMIGGLVNN